MLIRKQLVCLLVLTLFITAPSVTKAANILKIDSAYCFPSEQVTIAIEIINDDPAVSFQVDIPIPQYFSYVLNSVMLDPSRKADHIITASVISNSVLRIISYSPGNLAYNGNSGTIATFSLNASAVQGDFILEANNAILGNSNSQNIITAALDGNVKVMWPLTVYATSTPDTICIGDSVYLNAIGGGGTGIYDFSWYANNVLISLEQGLWINPDETSDYQVDLSDGISTNSAQVIVYCHPLPVVYAGIDQEICSNEPHYLYGSGQSYDSLLWTGGDGVFSDPSTLNSIYYPGQNDFLNEGVNITLKLFGEGNCATAEDTKYLSIIPAPYSFSGNDTLIHPDSLYYTSSANAANFNSLSWITRGDGYFNDPHSLHTHYYPGTQDIEADSVTLILEVEGDDLCSTAIDSLVIGFSIFVNTSLIDGLDFSIGPNPLTSFSKLSLTINRNGFYTVCIYDNQLKAVLRKELGFLPAGTYDLSLDLMAQSECRGNLYFFELAFQDGGKIYKKIQKLLFIHI